VYTFSLPNQQLSIEIQIINDTILEEDEQFLVGFSFLSQFVPVLSFQEQALVTILDDDSEFMHNHYIENEALAYSQLFHHDNNCTIASFIRVHAASIHALGGLLLSRLRFFPSTLLSNNSWL
jgi:hypothetical protein